MSESSDTVRVSLSPRHWPLRWFRHPDVPGVTVDTAGVDVDRDTADKLVEGAKGSGVELQITEPKPDAAPEESTAEHADPDDTGPAADSTVTLPATVLDDDTTKGAE